MRWRKAPPTLRYVPLPGAENLQIGGMRRYELGDEEIVVYRTPDGFFATDDSCSHMFMRFSIGTLEGNAVRCPLDGGTFDVRTGKAIVAPCRTPVRTHPVRTDGATVEVGLLERLR